MTLSATVESNNTEPIGRRQSLQQEIDRILNKLYLLPIHGATIINNTDQINTSPATSAGPETHHSRQIGLGFELDQRTLGLDLDLDLGIFYLLLCSFDQGFVVVENGGLVVLVGGHFGAPCSVHAAPDIPVS